MQKSKISQVLTSNINTAHTVVRAGFLHNLNWTGLLKFAQYFAPIRAAEICSLGPHLSCEISRHWANVWEKISTLFWSHWLWVCCRIHIPAVKFSCLVLAALVHQFGYKLWLCLLTQHILQPSFSTSLVTQSVYSTHWLCFDNTTCSRISWNLHISWICLTAEIFAVLQLFLHQLGPVVFLGVH